jgi:hypothetical protein
MMISIKYNSLIYTQAAELNSELQLRDVFVFLANDRGVC